MKLTKYFIEEIRKHTPQELKGKQNGYPMVLIGYYQPKGEHYSYNVGYIVHKGIGILVVKRFGEII